MQHYQERNKKALKMGEESSIYYTRLDKVDRMEIEWLWKPFLPLGKISILRGDPGQGKTSFALALAAMVSNGAVPPKSEEACKQGDVLIISAEDDINDALAPRLDKLGANEERVHFAHDILRGEPLTFTSDDFTGLLRFTNPSLLIVDPIQAFLGSGVDGYRANEVRPIMSRLMNLAREHNTAILLIEHLNKNAGGKAIHRGLGSMDFAAAARSVMMIGTNPNNRDEKGVALVKSSYAADGEVLGFRIDEGGLRWDEDSNIQYHTITGEPRPSGYRPYDGSSNEAALHKAVFFLEEVLKHGKRASKEIHVLAEGSNIKEMTLRRAREVLNVNCTEVTGYGKDRVVYWKLPDEAV